jgi:hypothetical protein
MAIAGMLRPSDIKCGLKPNRSSKPNLEALKPLNATEQVRFCFNTGLLLVPTFHLYSHTY